jgi:hypothetical protein
VVDDRDPFFDRAAADLAHLTGLRQPGGVLHREQL